MRRRLNDHGKMDWHYESIGVWVAAAKLSADDVPLFWRVRVEKTGLFSAAGSDSELVASSRQFTTYYEATSDCELREMTRIKGE